jgi:hypothetical protein
LNHTVTEAQERGWTALQNGNLPGSYIEVELPYD